MDQLCFFLLLIVFTFVIIFLCCHNWAMALVWQLWSCSLEILLIDCGKKYVMEDYPFNLIWFDFITKNQVLFELHFFHKVLNSFRFVAHRTILLHLLDHGYSTYTSMQLLCMPKGCGDLFFLHACTYCCGFFRWMAYMQKYCLHMLFMICFS